uniref:Phosphate carrier protein, mitochondrial n=1 Tax=Lygus hesperus TaxID=30085 RepID=A0A0A9XEI1_LYGHE
MTTMNSVLNYIVPLDKGATSKTWDARLSGTIPHDLSYYGKCMLGGVISCGTTHTLVTPLDVVKCNMQVDPTRYAGGKGNAFSRIAAKEGAMSLIKGWFPTAVGYSAQGLFKFGLYEYFKD